MIALLLGLATAGELEDARDAELTRARGEVANQVQLSAYDLLDELVYGWVTEPVFASPTPVVLASVTVPVGLGTGMQGLLENHLANLLIENPATNIQLSHCPSCTAFRTAWSSCWEPGAPAKGAMLCGRFRTWLTFRT